MRFEDQATDDANTKRLKDAYRWGVVHGSISPDSHRGRLLWDVICGVSGAYEKYKSLT